MVTFETEILVHGKTATYFVVPDEAVAALSDRKRPPVRVTIGDHTYRSTVAPMGGEYLIPLNRDNRSRVGAAAGDRVTVSLELDTEPRVVEVPDDLADALGVDDEAAATFEGLSFTHQREYVEWIVEAKRAETRERRIGRTIEMLLARSREAAGPG